jgi:ferrochelatase
MNDSVADIKKVKTAILLLAHGAPNSVDDIPLYLKNIRGGTESSPDVVQIIKDRYNAIGGSSPLLEITQAQANALQELLNQVNDSFKVYVGMRNWSPYIKSSIEQCIKDGAERIITICLAPQYSKWSTERYMTSFKEGFQKCSGGDIETRFISSWADHPGLIDAFVERYYAAIEREKNEGREDIHIIFTAHSIPAESLDYGDPYDKEYKKTFKEIVDRVKPDKWHSAYQSQGMIPIPWLGPTVEETLDKIADSGGKNVLIMPVGFMCDHIEILFDIDIEFKEYAKKKNLELSRTESLNTSPIFIQALAEVIWGHMI